MELIPDIECIVDKVQETQLIEMLKDHEGSKMKNGRHIPYRDTVGKLTIGYGHNLTDRGLSEKAATFIFAEDIQEHCEGILALHPWINTLDAVRQNVLYDMAFNLGVAGLDKWKTFLTYVKAGMYTEAADKMKNTKWARQVGRRAVRLTEMMRSGEYPTLK